MTEKNNEEKQFSALSLAGNLGWQIALPIVLFGLIGRWLDKKWETSPWLLLVGILLAISVSGYLVYRETKKIIK